jgi:hypothetical protein
MKELETKITAWRARQKTALPGQTDRVRELESHLRDHIEALRREGMKPEDAMDLAIARLGEPAALAREFGKLPPAWLPAARPVRVILGLGALMMVATLVRVGLLFAAGKMGLLLVVHVLIVFAGYLAVLVGGLVGGYALVVASCRPLSGRERKEWTRLLAWLAAGSSGLLPVGMVLGMVWAAENLGTAWAWKPVEIGALAVWVSAILLWLAQTRWSVRGHLPWLIAVLGGVVMFFGWIVAAARTPLPIAWFCGAFVAAQLAILVLRREPRAVA